MCEIHRVLRPQGYALLYDGVSDLPKEAWVAARQDFGRFPTTMMRVHAFEEPFYSCEQFARLAESTPFGSGELRYAGVMCCLVLRKGTE
jgi:hypothetical protein